MIAEKLLEAILSGDFEVGDALPSERELGVQFGVSRTVIREAIRSLSTKGVVEVQSGRGVQVLAIDAAPVTEAISLLLRGTPDVSFLHIHEVRLMLETHVAGVAAERALPENIEELDGLLAFMGQFNSESGSASLVRKPDFEVHRAIARAAQNELYLVLLDSIAAVLFKIRTAILARFENPYPFLDEHRAIVEGIKSHDATAASHAMEQHLTRVWRVWRDLGLNEQESVTSRAL
jgi:GntR family transcriptional repressor for pyruvate dehydrogenase complex